MLFHHDAPNSHFLGFNFLEFLVNSIQTIVNLYSITVKAMLHLKKIPSVESKFYTNLEI